jgi:hypothetical protein
MYNFSVNLPQAKIFARHLLVLNETKDNVLVMYDNNFNYIGESNASYKTGIVCDSRYGISSIARRVSQDENILYLSRIKW